MVQAPEANINRNCTNEDGLIRRLGLPQQLFNLPDVTLFGHMTQAIAI